jgi:AraC-like DNA-binding protein
MARPSKEPAAPSALVPALLRLLRARDAETAALAACRLGIDATAVDADETPATESAIQAALEASADAFGEPHLALRLPDDLPLRRYGLAELAARSTATLRDGIARLAAYAPLIHPAIVCSLDEAGDEATWTQRTPSRPRGLGLHANEYAVAYPLSHARRETGEPLSTTRAWFSNARPRDIAPLHRFFGTREVAFGCEDSGFALPRAALDRPMRGGDPRLLATADDLARAAMLAQPRTSGLLTAVASRIEAFLPNEATIVSVARTMHMSGRTLQRRLDAEHTAFSEVVDDVRERLARRWLDEGTQSLAEVAYALGFSDLGAFSRAFKRWTGQPPGSFRDRAGRGSP